jgi:sugar phosphate isomerase/epimerase
MRELAGHLELCSINTATLGYQLPVGETIEAIARRGFGALSLWRREVEGEDVAAIARHISDSGLQVASYCRSSYIPALTAEQFEAAHSDNCRALDTAAKLGAGCFVMVVGSLPTGSQDLGRARIQVAEGVTHLLWHAKAVGVRLALEPLHPMYAADRSCLNTLEQALDIADMIEGNVEDPWLGVALDAYHVWWDPKLPEQTARAGRARRIFAHHVSDWLVPTTDFLNDRGMMGDGVIDLKAIRAMVEAASYSGMVEVEIFSAANWWKRPVEDTLAVCAQRLQRDC